MTVKRLLSIDGGGIRGIIAAEILVQIEDALKAYNPKWQRLSDYFDFISGTSTGSIIATGLATGMSAHELLKLYTDEDTRKEEDKIFKLKKYSDQDLDDLIKSFGISDGWLGVISQAIRMAGFKDKLCQILLTKYSGDNLEKKLKDVLGEKVTLVSSNLKTNLMIVTNNVTCGQNWFFVNNTVKGEYEKESKYLKLNADIPLWQIVRASSAAPTFFPPLSFEIQLPKNQLSGEPVTQQCEFIDGGIGAYNNSSFQLFLEAVHPQYGTHWECGTDKLLLVSIGTGFGYADMAFGEAIKKNNAAWGGYLVGDLMYEANLQQNQLIKLISNQKTNRDLNFLENGNSTFSENGDSFKIVPQKQELLTYCRFTTSLTVERFKKLTNEGFLQLKDENDRPIQADAITKELVDKLEKMDCIDQIKNLSAIGQAITKEQFKLDLFKGFLED